MHCIKSLAVMALATCLLVTFSANAFSLIGNVDGWDAQRLAEAGIRVANHEHELTGEDPPFPWIHVSFDCADMPEDQPVVMTLRLYDKDERPIAMRSVRSAATPDEVSLTFAITPDQVQPYSTLDIVVWWPTSDGGREARGYQLSLTRITELASEHEVDQEGG